MSEPTPPEDALESTGKSGSTAETAVKPDSRRQRKIIAYFLTGAAGILDTVDFLQTTQEDHDTVLQRLSSGEIGTTQIDKMLSLKSTALGRDLSDPAAKTKAQEVLNKLADNRQGRAVIAEFVKGSINLRDSLTDLDLIAFVKAQPSPNNFEQELEPFLGKLTIENGPEKRAQYIASADKMMATVYGKRYEYWQQTKLLLEESRKKYGQRLQSVRKLSPTPAPETKTEPDSNGDYGIKILEVIDMETGKNIPVEEHLAHQRRKLS